MKKTIIALDFPDKETVYDFLEKFDDEIFVKLGMEIVYSEGLHIIEEIKFMGHKIFLDLKLHDIPNTVMNAMRALAKRKVDMINVHAGGGIEMMKAAIKGLELGSNGDIPICVAVTQLTSTSQEMMNRELLVDGELGNVVLQYAENAKIAGMNGVVCSAYEAKKIHERCGSDFLTVTPGIRLANGNVHDQKRVATPEMARREGSDFIVVGRSITESQNPVITYRDIENIMEN